MSRKPNIKAPTRNEPLNPLNPLRDHLAAELAKEYVRLIKQSSETNKIMESDKCVLQFMPDTAQKTNVLKA